MSRTVVERKNDLEERLIRAMLQKMNAKALSLSDADLEEYIIA